jgi:hypothetical protein
MIEQLEYSESVGVPSDAKTARAALRLLGAFNAGTAIFAATSAERREDLAAAHKRDADADRDR